LAWGSLTAPASCLASSARTSNCMAVSGADITGS
jgi:hypothetical protein